MGVGLQIELEDIENRIILRIDGRLDAPSAPTLEKKVDRLIEENHTHLILDFSKIEYLSSAGIRVLLSAQKKLKAKNGKLLLFSVNEDVLEVIKMAGFDKIFHIFSSEKEALQYHQ